MPEVSVVMPCLNEEASLGQCIDQAKEAARESSLDAEIIVVDNGSTDGSCSIAKKKGARLVHEKQRGYGSAYLKGIREAKGKYVFMADSDGTYDFRELPRFISQLKQGFGFVIGNRFKGRMERGAMPLLHRFVGNPLLSALLRLFFHSKVGDAHCGMRAASKKALERLGLKSLGMEFASEMVVMAERKGLKIKELPINYYSREGKAKLSSFHDGWRHLRFMLLFAPNYLFLVPGSFLFLAGAVISALFLMGPVNFFGLTLYNRPMVLGSFFMILGYQIIALGVFAKAYMKSFGFIRSSRLLDFIARFFSFESGLLAGALLLLASLALSLNVFLHWLYSGFPALASNLLLFALTLAVLGIQTAFSSFFISVLLMGRD